MRGAEFLSTTGADHGQKGGGKGGTYILNEDTQPVIRAIGVSHTACKDEFRQIFDLTAGVYFNFYNT